MYAFPCHSVSVNFIIADPNMLPKLQVDKGAIKFILSGANIMAPGLTSPGACMAIDIPADTVVVSCEFVVEMWTYYEDSSICGWA